MLDVAARRLTLEGEERHLTPKVFDLLVLLAQAAPDVVTKATLHQKLWPDSFVSDATLSGVIKDLRKALSSTQDTASLLRTVYGVGYALDIDGSRTNEPADKWRCALVTTGRQVLLKNGDNVVGRDPATEVWLDAKSVSRRHALLTLRDGHVTLSDLGSKNGTRLNGHTVEAPTELFDGARVEFGAESLLFRYLKGSEDTETQA